ncbi:hypothetical protein RFI_15654, partial [Reticulomyxa filosa]
AVIPKGTNATVPIRHSHLESNGSVGVIKNLGLAKTLPSSCHQCKKRKEIPQLAFCTRNCNNKVFFFFLKKKIDYLYMFFLCHVKFGKCSKKFCDNCLKKYLHTNLIKKLIKAQTKFREQFQKKFGGNNNI